MIVSIMYNVVSEFSLLLQVKINNRTINRKPKILGLPGKPRVYKIMLKTKLIEPLVSVKKYLLK